ncbi:DUF1800 domain-containing protein [Ideonella sp. BN130291]|uniref:DUF1800 domain-containing protein n=1 Tax=Ideonella sp. BN130291 TaxID=3112940 RepID=UPI002E262166|nr:DUF1800 domain-containing protein [Ideonella sp. BN130291]
MPLRLATGRTGVCLSLLLPLTIALLPGCAAPPAPGGSGVSAAQPLRAATAPQDVAWLNRLTWGASASSLAEWQRLGRERWLQAQLQPGPVAPLPAAVHARIDAMAISRTPLPELARSLEAQRKQLDSIADDAQKQAARQAYQQQLNGLAREAASRMLLRAIYSPQQLREQMTWFWFNHFNVHQGKHALRAAVGDYEEQLRTHALGRFRDLLRASALHPAMLLYLDNAQNAAGHLNENYARELLELHTLGVDGGYGQGDVQALARVLTGLGVRLNDETPRVRPALQPSLWQQGLVLFHPGRHDFGDKQLLGETVRGTGMPEIGQVLDRLARHPSTARFVSRRIAQYFVADVPPPALVERMSRRFQQTDGDIAQVLRTMVDSPEFAASLGHQFKDPLHYVVSAVRLAYDDQPVLSTAPLLHWLNQLGETPYNHPTPDGYPLEQAAWAGPGQMNTRFEIARAIGAGSAGLFRAEGAPPPERLPPPQLASPLYREGIAPALAPATRQTLAQAGSPSEWNALLLASPEFMHR